MIRDKEKSKDQIKMNNEEENKVTNRGLLKGVWEGGWTKWVRGTKESTPEIIVALYAN